MVSEFDRDENDRDRGRFGWGGAKRGGLPAFSSDGGGNVAVQPEPFVGLSAELGWKLVGAVMALSSVLSGLLILSGVYDTEVSIATALLIPLAGVLLGGSFYLAGAKHAPSIWMHAVPLTAFVLLAFSLGTMGSAEPRLMIGYAIPLIWVAIFMSPRAIGGYIALTAVVFALTWARHADDSSAGVPMIITVIPLIAVCVVTMLARRQLDRVVEQASLLSGRDPLTGLPNLRPLYDRVETLIQRAQRDDGSVSVVMIDLDGFKYVNDHYSRSTGDSTLRAVGRALETASREHELVARRGGDEFAVVTEAHAIDDLEALVERLSGEVAGARLAISPDAPASLTAGIASFQEGDTVARLLARADRALQEAKLRSRSSWVADEDATA